MSSRRVSVAVINHNTCDELRECLKSVVADAASEIIVVDNASTDGSSEMVRREFPSVVLINRADNPGYGTAANQAIEAASEAIVLLLNSDTRVKRGVLAGMAEYFDRHDAVGLIGPRLLNIDGTHQISCFPFPGTIRWFLENEPAATIAGRLPRLRSKLLLFSPPPHATEVPWVLGAAIVVRKSAFADIGGFDESFFMYYEEVDLCLRLKEAGWEVHYLPSAEVFHVGGASTSQRRAEMVVQHFKSTLQFYEKHYTRSRRYVWISLMYTKMLARLARDLLRWAFTSDVGRRAELEKQLAAWYLAVRSGLGQQPGVSS